MSKLLTKEIVVRVLADVGLIDLSNRQTWDGICNLELKSKKTVKIQYDAETIAHDVYCGKLVFNEFFMNGLLVDLGVTVSNKSVNELVFVFQAKDKPIHGLFYTDDGATVKIYNDKAGNWKDATVQLQSMMLSGFEQLCSLGVLWQPSNETDDLYKAALNLISTAED